MKLGRLQCVVDVHAGVAANTVLVAMMIFGAIGGSLMVGAPAKADHR